MSIDITAPRCGSIWKPWRLWDRDEVALDEVTHGEGFEWLTLRSQKPSKLLVWEDDPAIRRTLQIVVFYIFPDHFDNLTS